jgi:hypothetical protein
MNNYETVFETLHTSFITNLSIFRNSCEELLNPLTLPNNKLQELLEDHNGSVWEDAVLGEKLRGRLGDDYVLYKTSVRQLNKKINLFGRKLKLLDNMRVCFQIEPRRDLPH